MKSKNRLPQWFPVKDVFFSLGGIWQRVMTFWVVTGDADGSQRIKATDAAISPQSTELRLLLSCSVVSDSARPYRWQSARLLPVSGVLQARTLGCSPSLGFSRQERLAAPRPWGSPGKNTGAGCHCLLQCMKVKSEREVAQSCPTLSDPMDCSLPGSSVHGIFQARVLEWGAIASSEHTGRCPQTNKLSGLKCKWKVEKYC